ncbi:MAG: hypothetical protein ACREDR_07520, partial [Blastocatellia bacterium]
YLIARKWRYRKNQLYALVIMAGLAIVSIGLWSYLSLRKYVADSEAVYRVRVTVLGPRNNAVDNVEIVPAIGGELKKVLGGWELDIPTAVKPKNGALRIYASAQDGTLKGTGEVSLGSDYNPVAIIHLSHDTTARFCGKVVDDHSLPLLGARVYTSGNERESILTSGDGTFDLPAHAAQNEQVHYFVSKEGYTPTDDWVPAGCSEFEVRLTVSK